MYYYYYYNRFTALKLEQEIVSGNGISWAICRSAPRPRLITMPESHHSVFNRLDALPAAQQRQSTEGQELGLSPKCCRELSGA